MEPLTTTAAISALTGYLAKKLKDNKSVQSFFDDFTEATVNWIKPIFIREDGAPEKALKDLQEKPDSIVRQDAVKSSLAVALEDDPRAETLLREMVASIEEKKTKGEAVTITNSKNINMGNISSGGNVTLGDNNNINK
jgi:hypothetical protein